MSGSRLGWHGPDGTGARGAHPQAGITIAGTLDQARPRLADMASIGLDTRPLSQDTSEIQARHAGDPKESTMQTTSVHIGGVAAERAHRRQGLR